MLNPSKYTLNAFKRILEGLTLKIEVYGRGRRFRYSGSQEIKKKE